MSSASKSLAEMTTLMTVAPLVIASRMTEFWLTAASPTAHSRNEVGLMVTEKMQAMGESAVAMSMESARLCVEGCLAAARGVQVSLGNQADEILAAGLKPYSTRVRANNRRLSRHKVG